MVETDLDWVIKTEKSCYDFPWSKKGFEKVLDDGLAYIFCNRQGERLGYACFMSVLDEIHLLNIAVNPVYQQQAVATNALPLLIKHFQSLDFKTMFLEVRKSNPVIKLYQANNFKIDGIRKGYYPVNMALNQQGKPVKEDAILMSCLLNHTPLGTF